MMDLDCLLNSAYMYTEKNSLNLQRLFWIMYAYMQVSSKSVCATLSDYMTSKLNEIFQSQPPIGWNTDTIVVCFEVLTCMSEIHTKFPRNISNIILSICSSATNWIDKIEQVRVVFLRVVWQIC